MSASRRFASIAANQGGFRRGSKKRNHQEAEQQPVTLTGRLDALFKEYQMGKVPEAAVLLDAIDRWKASRERFKNWPMEGLKGLEELERELRESMGQMAAVATVTAEQTETLQSVQRTVSSQAPQVSTDTSANGSVTTSANVSDQTAEPELPVLQIDELTDQSEDLLCESDDSEQDRTVDVSQLVADLREIIDQTRADYEAMQAIMDGHLDRLDRMDQALAAVVATDYTAVQTIADNGQQSVRRNAAAEAKLQDFDTKKARLEAHLRQPGQRIPRALKQFAVEELFPLLARRHQVLSYIIEQGLPMDTQERWAAELEATPTTDTPARVAIVLPAEPEPDFPESEVGELPVLPEPLDTDDDTEIAEELPEEQSTPESVATPAVVTEVTTDFEAMKVRLIAELDIELAPGKRRHISPELKRFAVQTLFPQLRETRDLTAFLKAHGLHSPTPSIWAKQLEAHDAVEETVGAQVLSPLASVADTQQAEPEIPHDSVTESEELAAAEPVKRVESVLLPDDFAQKKAAFEAALVAEPGRNRRVSTELKQFALEQLFPSLRRERSLTSYLKQHGLNINIPTVWKTQLETRAAVAAVVPAAMSSSTNGAVTAAPKAPAPVIRTRAGAETARFHEVRVTTKSVAKKRAPSIRSWEKSLDDGFTRAERLQILDDVATKEGNVPALQALYAEKSITVRQVLDWRATYGKYSREKLLGSQDLADDAANADDDDDDTDSDLMDEPQRQLLPAAEIGTIVFDPLVDLDEEANKLFEGKAAQTIAGAYRASVIAQSAALSPEKRERLHKIGLLSTNLLSEEQWAEWHELICEKFGLTPSEKTEQYAHLLHTPPAARSDAQQRWIEMLAQAIWPYSA